jgi:hypothetical protein
MKIEGGESLRSAKVKVADALVRGPQFTNVVDLVGSGRWTTLVRPSWVSTFQIVEGELSDKEHARWGPTITVNRRSTDTSVLVGSRPQTLNSCERDGREPLGNPQSNGVLRYRRSERIKISEEITCFQEQR